MTISPLLAKGEHIAIGIHAATVDDATFLAGRWIYSCRWILKLGGSFLLIQGPSGKFYLSDRSEVAVGVRSPRPFQQKRDPLETGFAWEEQIRAYCVKDANVVKAVQYVMGIDPADGLNETVTEIRAINGKEQG